VHPRPLWRVALAVLVAGGLAAACSSTGSPVARAPVTTPSVDPTAPATRPTTPATPTTPPATVAPTTSTTTPPAARPPYPLRFELLPLIDASRRTISHGIVVALTRKLTTLVWMPAEPGRWPLVVFAHGFEVGPAPYVHLLEAWAAQGFVVAAPEFPLTDEAIAGANLDENDIQQQPADVRYVIDALVAPGAPLAARIDASRVGVAGHSDGAETALAVSALPTPTGEPAIRAVIAMSVQPLTGVTSTANPPILVTQGDADTINPPAWGQQTWAEAAGPKYLAILHGAGHLPPLEAGSPWLPVVEATTEAFLRTYVARDAPSAGILAAGTDPPRMTITAAA